MKERNLYAIFGDPVAHSRSPIMHNHVFKRLNVNACYTRVHLKDGTQLKNTFLALGLSGANITVPHKEAAYQACDEIRGFANEIGVVNTIINENGRLIGYNTDAAGFLFSIEDFKDIKKILIIGAGGTAKALAKKFKNENYDVSILNRSKGKLVYFNEAGFTSYTWEDCPVLSYDLIVNTTSAGLSDDNYPAPIELLTSLLQKTSFCADAIYGKLTPFLKLCQEMNITYKDGSDMLLGQGVLANHYFTEGRFSHEEIQNAMKESFLF